jgi:hypothetical protein
LGAVEVWLLGTSGKDVAKEMGIEFAFPTRALHVETMPIELVGADIGRHLLAVEPAEAQ